MKIHGVLTGSQLKVLPQIILQNTAWLLIIVTKYNFYLMDK